MYYNFSNRYAPLFLGSQDSLLIKCLILYLSNTNTIDSSTHLFLKNQYSEGKH